jgi:hypothetical protein
MERCIEARKQALIDPKKSIWEQYPVILTLYWQGGDVMVDDSNYSGAPNRPRCGQVMSEVAGIPPFGRDPGLRIFECSAGNFTLRNHKSAATSNQGAGPR